MLNTGVVGAGIKDFCWKQTRPYVERDERLEILMIYCTVQINTKTIQYSTRTRTCTRTIYFLINV
jgi:hypothetical protein